MILLPHTDRLTLEPPAPGLHLNVPAETYHAWRAVSAGLLKVVHSQTLAHAHEYMHHGSGSSDAKAFGSAAHCFYFEPERYFREYYIWPGLDRRTKEGKALWEAALATVGGDETRILTMDDSKRLFAMLTAIREGSMGRRLLLVKGDIEACLVWVDEPTGLVCKARADKLTRGIRFGDVPTNCIIDLKTTTSANPADFARDAARFGYDITAGHYCTGAEAVLNDPARYFLLAQEKDAPYLSCLYDCGHEAHDPKAVDVGRTKAAEAMQRLATALSSDQWPGYPDDFQPLALPAWALAEEVA